MGGQTILHIAGGKHFSHGVQTLYVEDIGVDDDVDGKEEDGSKAYILMIKARKHSAGARIFKGP